MSLRRRRTGDPLIRRVRLDQPTPLGYLWAPFPNHMKAAAASLLPFAVLFFVVQSPSEAFITLATGGLLVTPIVILAYCAAWAVMSYGVTHVLRHNTSAGTHFAAYALVGAAVLTALAFLLVSAWTLPRGLAVWSHGGFVPLMTWAPALGAVGSAIGRLALRWELDWFADVEADPGAGALRFETRKRDKDDWEQL